MEIPYFVGSEEPQKYIKNVLRRGKIKGIPVALEFELHHVTADG